MVCLSVKCWEKKHYSKPLAASPLIALAYTRPARYACYIKPEAYDLSLWSPCIFFFVRVSSFVQWRNWIRVYGWTLIPFFPLQRETSRWKIAQEVSGVSLIGLLAAWTSDHNWSIERENSQDAGSHSVTQESVIVISLNEI